QTIDYPERVFCWRDISSFHLAILEDHLEAKGLSSHSIYTLLHLVLDLITFATTNAICGAVFYNIRSRPCEMVSQATLAGQQAGIAQLPSDAALRGLAQLYRDRDRVT